LLSEKQFKKQIKHNKKLKTGGGGNKEQNI